MSNEWKCKLIQNCYDLMYLSIVNGVSGQIAEKQADRRLYLSGYKWYFDSQRDLSRTYDIPHKDNDVCLFV